MSLQISATRTGEKPTTDLIYAHCAVRARSRPVTARWPRMPRGGSPRALDLGNGLWVIVSTVPGKEYESGLARRLSDVEWLAECGVAHHEVIARAAHGRGVAPFRLLTLFRSDDRAIAEVTRLRARIERALDRVNDRREWVVRVAAVAQARRPKNRPISRSGTSYLMERAAQSSRWRAGAASASADARRVARALIAALNEYADQVVQRPSEAAHVLYDGALLVSREREHDLGNVVRQWAPRLAPVGCRVSLTGPWPPYSFVSLDGRRSGASHDRG
ncbi:MAG TPA: GvpL/GvpF family gas vesicle protein [Vicinamibacterales bacterium]|nr:GvpL/GvpF family gas vesicle protein [Vicinamibacterales bacterium]